MNEITNGAAKGIEEQIYRVSYKLTALGYLLENQGESSDGVVELIGLGTAITDYASEIMELSRRWGELSF